MREVVYKQWYFSQHEYNTATSNVEHLKYIAFRNHAIPNKGYGHCLWGKISGMWEPGNIDNMRMAIQEVKNQSKEHTLYRTVVSLPEDVAKEKGIDNREAWQGLVERNVATIAKENDIELKDFRWCASYHQKRGNPHAHIIFWDSSDRIRDEFVARERFDIAVEHIRARFNGDIFQEELRLMREEQNEEKREIRQAGRNIVSGFSNLLFFEDESKLLQQDTPISPKIYPSEISAEAASEVVESLERLIHALPATGQLQYQYLSPEVKALVDEVSNLLIKNTSMENPHARYLDTTAQIAQTYGNRGEQIAYEIGKAHKKVLKDIGNDVLKAVKNQGLLNTASDDRRQELREIAGEAAIEAADRAVEEKMKDPVFREEFQKVVRAMPERFAPMNIVLEDGWVSERLRKLTLECCNSSEVKHRMRVSQAIWNAVGEKAAEPYRQPITAESQPIQVEAYPLLQDTEKLQSHLVELGRSFALPGMSHEEKLSQLEAVSPVRVEYERDYHTDGEFNPAAKEICIRSNIAPEDKVVALAREIANARYYDQWGSVNEAVANCAAVAQCAQLGVEVDWLELDGVKELALNDNGAQFIYKEITKAAWMDAGYNRLHYYNSPALMLQNPGIFVDYLKSRGGLHQYGTKNFHRILEQCPDAKMVLSEKQWEKLGREIKEDAVPITILKAVKVGGEVEFQKQDVYDISDTEGDPVDILEDKTPRQLFNILKGLEKACPVPVRYVDSPVDESRYDPAAKEIRVWSDMEVIEQIFVVASESAHARMHQEKGKDWSRVEVIAQCAAIKTCAYYGLNAPAPDGSMVERLVNNAPFDKTEFAKMFIDHVEEASGKYQNIWLNAKNEEEKEKKERDNQAFKAVYRYLFKKLYQQAEDSKGWTQQRKTATFLHFLMDFARITQQSNHNYRNNLLSVKRSLSKQAKREFAKKLENSSQMWE